MASTDLTLESFAQCVSDDGVILVDFWAEWCGPCRAFAPVFEAASKRHADLVFAKVNTEAEQQLAALFRITSIPTLLVFRDRIIVFSQPGALSAPQLEQVIEGTRQLNMDEVRQQLAEQEATGNADGAQL